MCTNLNESTNKLPAAIKRTFKVGLGVFKIRTAHCINVFGGSLSGTTGSSSTGNALSSRRSLLSLTFGDETGGGSANSGRKDHQLVCHAWRVNDCSAPSETGRSSTKRQPDPSSGTSIDTISTALVFAVTCTAKVQAFNPVSLFPVRKSKSYLTQRYQKCRDKKWRAHLTDLCHGQTATTLLSHSSISAWDISAPRCGQLASIA